MQYETMIDTYKRIRPRKVHHNIRGILSLMLYLNELNISHLLPLNFSAYPGLEKTFGDYKRLDV